MKLEEFERILDSYGVKYEKFDSEWCLCYYEHPLVNKDLIATEGTNGFYIISCPVRKYIDMIFRRWLEAEEGIYL